jgi:hypothetical protein
MKKLSYPFLLLLVVSLFCFCDKKLIDPAPETSGSNSSAAISKTSSTYSYSTNSATLSGPPNSYFTNPATQNSSLLVGGAAWSYLGCAATSSVTLKAINGNINVTIDFLFPPSTGTYAIASSPGPASCMLKVLNAPNQPAGITWYAQSGQVVVNTTSTSISASFSVIPCTQQNFNFPIVSASGNISCN